MLEVSTCRNSCWGCLRPTLGRHGGHGALDELEQRLLYALAGHIAGDGRIIGLARNLVDLVDVDNAHLGLLNIVIAFLQQLLDDVLDILPDITRFRQRGGIGDGERHVEQAGQGFGEQRLTGARGADQQDVALAQLHIVSAAAIVTQTLVVVVHRDGQHLFGALLADDVFVENGVDFIRHGQLVIAALGAAVLDFLADNVVTQIDAFITDEHGRSGNQLAHLVLALATERAVEKFAAVVRIGRPLTHWLVFASQGLRAVLE